MSIWEKGIGNRKIKELNKNINVDILIIGAGMTGMTTAYYLQDKDICVVDANTIGMGVTLNSTAKINYFQERIYSKIKAVRSETSAINYLKSQKYAIKNLKEIIEKEKIDCDFTKASSYVFANTLKEVKKLDEEIKFLRDNGVDVYKKKLPEKITSYKSYCVNDTYIFNPLKYLLGLYDILINNKISIYENSKILKIVREGDKYICYGNKFQIETNKIVLACHYPYFTIPFLLPFKSSIEKSYIIVSKVNNSNNNFTCISSNRPTYSCRFYKVGSDIYQLSLAESHDASVKQNDKYHFKRVKEIFGLKDEDIIECYSNTDIMTPDHMPYIGLIKDNMYIGCGYNTWGMTNSILAAKIISDTILNKENEFKCFFKPNRIKLIHIINLPLIIFNQTKSFLGTKLNKNKKWYTNKLTFFRKNNKSYACYQDKEGEKHIVHNKCPHLGCSLIFNEEELTWDCPCHSSRFNLDGKCIKGPSNYDISYNKSKNT